MVDLSFLEQFTKGNKNKMVRYIGMYLRIAPATFKDMNNISESKNGSKSGSKRIPSSPRPNIWGLRI